MRGFYMDSSYLLLVVFSMVLGFITQSYIKSTYAKWSQVSSGLKRTGADVARRMLNEGGASEVGIGRVAGTLTDNYDPRDNCLHLSDDNYGGGSVASVAVACHEAGHAIQNAKGYAPMKFRTALVPVVSFTQNIWMLVLIAGMMMGIAGLTQLAIILFAFSVLFQLVTLPVEIDASRRAVAYLKSTGSGIDEKGAKQVLTAAALTYVASALISVANLLYLMGRTSRR
ncbi:MAG: zinc metallopeptidase [Coriobacteriales bacterium]|nr:zinc metallopeptidase [Coriobacteriales bacterium]